MSFSKSAARPHAARRRLWTEAACYHILNRGPARESVFHEANEATLMRVFADSPQPELSIRSISRRHASPRLNLGSLRH